jgi:hypothetical protein
MNSEDLRAAIRENGHELARLHARIHETLKHRGVSADLRAQWETACTEFHARFDSLAFPGGYEGALDRISSGDALAMEAGVCFLECRPYFFRSGYMYKDILRRLKLAPLSESQALRLQMILERLKEWKSLRKLERENPREE